MPTAAATSRSVRMDLEKWVILSFSPMLRVAGAKPPGERRETRKRETVLWLQHAVRDAAQGDTLNAMVRGGVGCVRVESDPLLSKHVFSLFHVFLMFLLLSLPFFSFVNDLSLSDLSLSAPISRH